MRGLADMLSRLSRRERWLVGLLAGLALPLAAIFLVLVPMVETRAAAARDLAAAEDLLRWIDAQARAYPPPRDGSVSESVSGPAGLAGLERSLVAAGLRERVTALTNRGGGAVELQFDQVVFTDLMGWVARLETELGYRLAGFGLDALDLPGHVAATLVLEPAA